MALELHTWQTEAGVVGQRPRTCCEAEPRVGPS